MIRHRLLLPALVISIVMLPLVLGGSGGRAQDAATPVTSPAAQMGPGGWTNFKGDAGRRGVGDAGPTGQPVELWRVQAGGPCNPPPAAVGGVIYATCGDGILYALDAATGNERWRFVGSSLGDVTVADDLVYVNDQDVLRALDTATGEERWNAAVVGGTSAIVEGGLLVIGTADGFLLGLDAADGTEQWRFQVSPNGAAHNPAMSDGIAYAGGDDPGFFAIDVSSGELLWRGDTGDDQTGTAVVAEGIAYIGGSAESGEGRLYAFDAATGSLLWRRDEPIFTPAVLDGIGYSGSVAGIVYAFDTATGAERWRVQLGGVVRPLAVTTGVVYAPSDGDRAVYALDAATGQQLWKFDVDGGIDGSIAVDGGVAYVTTTFGSIYAVGGTTQGATPVASAAASPLATPLSDGAAPVTVVWQVGADKLDGAADIAIDGNNRIWVADSNHGRFAIFDEDGSFIEYWSGPGTGDGQFDLLRENGDPYGAIVFAPDETYFILDVGNYRVQHFAADRTFLNAWGSSGGEPGKFIDPVGIAVDASGLVYVVDDQRGVVEWYSADGRVEGSFGLNREGRSVESNGLALDANGNIYVSNITPYEVQKFDRSGTLLATIGEFGFGDGQYAGQPTGIAIDENGRIFVSEGPESGRVQVFTADGTFLAGWGEAGEFPWAFALDGKGDLYISDLFENTLTKFRLTPPLATDAVTGSPAEFLWQTQGGPDGIETFYVAVAPDGTVWANDAGKGRFQLFAPDGRYLETWSPEGVPADSALFIAFDGAGAIYVLDGRFVRKYGSDRIPIAMWGGEGTGDGQFQNTTGIGVDDAGNVYVCDEIRNDVQKFDADGRFLAKWGGPGSDDGQFDGAGFMDVDPQGNSYVVDHGNFRVQKFAPDGTFLLAIGAAGEGQLDAPNDVAIDGQGNIFVGESEVGRVRVFAADGSFLAEWGEFGSGEGQLTSADAVALDGMGNAYVADNLSGRIVKFRLLPPLGPEGTPTP
jgi:outer membrane protein assembly factor BamB/sugar lactone lactonase YvrE